MKLLKITLFFACFAITQISAQYTTPNTGVDWTLDDVAAASPETVTVSGNTYTLLENLTVSANDALRINTDLALEIEAGVRITVFGTFTVESNEVLITAVNPDAPYDGFRFEEFSEIAILNATIEYGGGLQVLTEDFVLDNCVLRHNVSGTATGAVVALSRGMPVIVNNTFLLNMNPAISSGATNQVSAYIANNHIESNNQTNSNRPQINMGATRVSDTLVIVGNTIIGNRDNDMAGGIAVANVAGGVIRTIIKDNIIRDNRYGITIMGPNSFASIKNNIIEDNDTQGDPMLGGSGINLNAPTGGQIVVASENQIRRNLWGITIQGAVNANFGDDEDNSGGNVFADNGNNGEVFALYNNGPNEIMAKHNCWIEGEDITLEDAESVIFHQADDPSLGEVIFDPVCEFLETPDFSVQNIVFYPNPVKDVLYFDNQHDFQKLDIYNINGQLVFSQNLTESSNTVKINLSSGLYFADFSNSAVSVVKKLLVE